MDEARPLLAAAVGAVEDGEVLRPEVGRSLDRHAAADRVRGFLELRLREAERLEEVELGILRLLREPEPRDRALADHVLAERVPEVERARERRLGLVDLLLGEALREERGAVHVRRAVQAQRALEVGEDRLDLGRRVTERLERGLDHLVDDLEVAAARELLELDEREIGLDPRGIAVHEETDGAGRREDGRLRVPVAVTLARRERAVPGLARRGEELGVGTIHSARGGMGAVGRYRVGGVPVLVHDPEHGLAVVREAREGPLARRDLGGGLVSGAGHERGDRGARRGATRAVVGDALDHEERAEVRVAEPERPEVVRVLRDRLRRVARVVDDDLLRDDEDPAGVPEGGDVEPGRRPGSPPTLDELHQVDRREVAARVVEEHELGAWVRRVDPARVRDRVPAVDGRVELDARVGAAPRGLRDLLHELARPVSPRHGARRPPARLPLAVLDAGAHEVIRHAHRVVRVLPGDRPVGLAVEVGGVARLDEGEDLVLLARLPLDELLHVGVIHVEDHHLRGAPRGAARLGRARRLVEDLEERHEAARGPARREELALGADRREVRARAAPELEEAHLALDTGRDVHEVVRDRLDEAGRDLRMGVGVLRLLDLARLRVPGPVADRLALDPVGLGEAAVEPGRRVERAELVDEHEHELVLERLRVLGRREVAAEPIARLADRGRDPAADLARGALGTEAAVGLGNLGLPEVLRDDDVRRELRPADRHLGVVHLEDDRAIGVRDHGPPRLVASGVERIGPVEPRREAAVDREARRAFPRAPGAGVPGLDVSRVEIERNAHVRPPIYCARHCSRLVAIAVVA